jgi:hypothetical protein
MKFLISFLILLYSFCGNAQDPPSKLHTPAEILKLISDSKLTYEIKELKTKIDVQDYSSKLNYNGVYRKEEENGFSTVKYNPNTASAEAYDKAEEAFQKNNVEQAQKYYLESYEKDSSFYQVMTYIGQTYGFQKNWNTAIDWYEKAIGKNYIDYMAHWFLADAYVALEKFEEAKKQILIAHVLNRNNPRIVGAMKNILKKNKLVYTDWYFNPQYKLTKTDSKIIVDCDLNWMTYALTKALWAYEPGYAESMGKKDDSFFNEDEEKEALVGILTQNKLKKLKEPELLALKTALDKKMVQAYIYYEILLPAHPVVAYQLPEELVNNIVDYLAEVRFQK